MSLNFNNMERRYIDVPAPYFGDSVVIRVNKRAVKHYMKASKLAIMVADRKDIHADDRVAYAVAIGLMSVCTIPETGEYAFADEQIDDLVNHLPRDLYENLAAAAFELDPIITDEPKTLTAKKKKS